MRPQIELMFESIKNTVRGAHILSEWLGAGGVPVSRDLAERRSQVCASCPHNFKGNWADRLKEAVADVIKDHVAIKNAACLTVSREQEMGFCLACGCVNKLKVWVPITHIAAHTRWQDDIIPPNCWVNSEIKPT